MRLLMATRHEPRQRAPMAWSWGGSLMKLHAHSSRVALVSGASLLALMIAAPVAAQSAGSTGGGTQSGTMQSSNIDDGGIEEIVVTAQRQAESLQDVPI